MTSSTSVTSESSGMKTDAAMPERHQRYSYVLYLRL